MYKIILQVLLVCICLTLFYYNYVLYVEKDEIVEQLNVIVKKLLGDKDRYKFMNDTNTNKIISRGILESIKEDQMINMQQSVDAANMNNASIKRESTVIVIIALALIVVVSVVFFFKYQCVEISTEIRDTMIIVFFVLISEFVFLNVISKNFVFADPNHIIQTICQTVADNVKER